MSQLEAEPSRAAAEPAPSTRDPLKREDPNYILSQREFHDSETRNWADHQETRSVVRREADALVTTAGWVAVSLGFWLLLVGFIAIRGEVRGRPWRGA